MADKGFALRAGLHCAPLAHASAGTLKTGTLRLSVSDLNTASEIFRFLNMTEEILDGIF
jgi:selenocysteine lyase/cysteine desulfurase